jgi:hypothetical protein
MSELDDELAAIDEQIALEAEVTALFALLVPMGLIYCLHKCCCLVYPSSWENLKRLPTCKTM